MGWLFVRLGVVLLLFSFDNVFSSWKSECYSEKTSSTLKEQEKDKF